MNQHGAVASNICQPTMKKKDAENIMPFSYCKERKRVVEYRLCLPWYKPKIIQYFKYFLEDDRQKSGWKQNKERQRIPDFVLPGKFSGSTLFPATPNLGVRSKKPPKPHNPWRERQAKYLGQDRYSQPAEEKNAGLILQCGSKSDNGRSTT